MALLAAVLVRGDVAATLIEVGEAEVTLLLGLAELDNVPPPSS